MLNIKEQIAEEDCTHAINGISGLQDFYSECTVVVLGANGIIGSTIVAALVYLNQHYDLDMHIIAISRSGPSLRLERFSQEKSIDCFQIDISGKIPDLQIHGECIFYHCASQASPKFYQTDPVGTLSANSIGTFNILEVCKNLNCKKFLFISAGEIYGQMESQIVSETMFGALDPMELRSCYAEGKRCGEALCKAYFHQYGIKTISARLFHTYGPGMLLDDSRIFADITRDIIEKGQIILHSDGSAVRCFCYASDVVNALLRLSLLGNAGEAYNIANTQETMSILALANKLSKAFELINSPRFINRPPISTYSASPFAKLIPDLTKIYDLGWKPEIGVKDGFSRTINWYLNELRY